MDMSKRLDAADRLEDLAVQAKAMVITLRDSDVSNELAYALIYELRKRLGYAVGVLGVGSPSAAATHDAVDILDNYV